MFKGLDWSIISFLKSIPRNVNQVSMKWKFALWLVVSLILGCVADEALEDGLVEGIGKVKRASIVFDESGAGQVDFEYAYLIGVNDSEGVQAFNWTYRLINPERDVFGENEQLMREAEPEKTTIYVQGSKPRVLDVVVPESARDEPLVLWISVRYGAGVVSELFIELDTETPYLDEEPLPKLNRFAQGA